MTAALHQLRSHPNSPMPPSSDESSTSSSDSSLLDTAIFKKDRKTQRAEKQKEDFLDKCLTRTDARTDVHRRIAEVEKEELLTHDRHSGTEEDGHVDANGTGAIKIKSQVVDNYDTNNVDDFNELSSVPVHVKSEPFIKQESEESYWNRVESFTKSNSAPAPTSQSAEITRVRRRDAMSGLEYDSATDNEEGQLNSFISHERRRGEAAAKLTGGQSCLGLRRVFRRTKKTGVCSDGTLLFHVFQSRNEAMDELNSLVVTLVTCHSHSQSREKLMLSQFVHPLARLLQLPRNKLWGREKQLIMFLRTNPVLSTGMDLTCRCDVKCTLKVPEVFLQWLWNVSCSSLHWNDVEITCCRLLMKMIKEEANVSKSGHGQGRNFCHVSVDLEWFKRFRMGELSRCLVNDFGLLLKSEPTNPNRTNNRVLFAKMEESELDVSSLRRLLLLWNKLLENDFLSLQEDECDNGAVGEGATKDLVALARASLDPHLELATQRQFTFGEDPMNIIQMTISSLVNSSVQQIRTQYNEQHVNQWMEGAATEIIYSCSDFSSGADGTADNDDVEGVFPLATVVSNILPCDMISDHFSYDCGLMKLCLCERALKEYLRPDDDWEERMNTINDGRSDHCGADAEHNILRKLSERAIHALIFAAVAFEWIEKEKDEIMKNLPYFLASIQIAGECVLVGTRIFFRTAQPFNARVRDSDWFVHYTVHETDFVHDTLSEIEECCEKLRKECSRRAVIAYPHLRRAKEYLHRFERVIGGIKGKSSKDKRQSRRSQGSLDCFFKFSQDD